MSKSYNSLLNNSTERRNHLIEALVFDTPFPNDEYAGLPHSVTPDATLLELLEARDFTLSDMIMQRQYETFGDINTALFWSVLRHLATITGDDRWIAGAPRGDNRVFLIPSEDVFAGWRAVHLEYYGDFIAKAKQYIGHNEGVYSNRELCTIIDQLLEYTGYKAKGWTVMQGRATNLIGVAKRKKRIFVGPQTVRLTRTRLVGLLLHEIAVHVAWAERGVEHLPKGMEEAIGTLVEQLTLSNYHTLRLFRFLAICFAIGVDGFPRDIRETYKKVLAVRRILKPYEEEEVARWYVAKEVVRVFRNLPHDRPGLVYIRDKEYFEYNSELWDVLVRQQPDIRAYQSIVAPWKDDV